MAVVLSSCPPRNASQDAALTYDQLAEGFRYDPASQVQQILHQLGATGPTINQAAYTYNGVGNRESLTDRRGVQSFGYDSLDRLTSASHPLLGTPQAFTYDPVGNRTTAGNVTNAGNQLTADSTHSYQYDDNGNLIRKTLLATGNYTQYTYDAENRLVKVEDFVAGNPTPAFTSSYRYDGLGRRIEKVANGQTRRYIYDGEDILLEYDGTNTLQARYTHGPGIDEPIAVTKGSATFFYHQDGLGSVTDLTDSAGATAKSYAYDAYGNILESPGTIEQPYTYTGREFDSESGLYYYRARSYDSIIGRFIEKDPIGLAADVNTYSYVGNDPVNWIDPQGLQKNRKPKVCILLRAAVVASCKAPTSCKEGDSCEVLKLKILLKRFCILSQTAHTRTCYPENPNHKQRIEDEEKGIKKCERILDTKLDECFDCPPQ
ncbi:MAG: RHS repeat-associated core domain-containing protein [Nitrospira sp.]